MKLFTNQPKELVDVLIKDGIVYTDPLYINELSDYFKFSWVANLDEIKALI